MDASSYCNSTHLGNFPEIFWNYTFGTIIAVVSFASTLENLILLLVMIKYPRLRTSSNVIVMSLIVADFFTGLLVGPLYVIQILLKSFVYNCAVQKVRKVLATIFIGTSITTVGFISVDRAHHLIKLQNYVMKDDVLYTVIGFCWGVPIVLPIIGSLTGDKTYSALVSLFGLTAISVVFFSYIALFKALRKKHNIVAVNMNYAYRKTRRIQKTAAKTAILILSVYLAMILPLFTEKIMYASSYVFKSKTDHPIFLIICVTLNLSNSALNPFIYCVRIPGIKKHLKKFLRLKSSKIAHTETVN